MNESLRDAQLGLYLSAIAPKDETLKSLKIAEHLKTANDLYQYWLLDVLVSQDVPTSPVACAIASLQQYINSILANMEPGYHTAQIPTDHVDTWRSVIHHYQAWAANQRLYYFPATYLDPTLRKTRTESFEQLEKRPQPQPAHCRVRANGCAGLSDQAGRSGQPGNRQRLH
ncbi:neuraminidase-like domain-containing protein [Pseudomonas lini]